MNERILIVDDSPTEVKKISSILEKHKHEVLTADNGADGVAKARAETPDLVLMDVVMPGLNGFQATRQLTRAPETASIPVVIVTTRDQETDRVRGGRLLCSDELVQPGKRLRVHRGGSEAGDRQVVSQIGSGCKRDNPVLFPMYKIEKGLGRGGQVLGMLPDQVPVGDYRKAPHGYDLQVVIF